MMYILMVAMVLMYLLILIRLILQDREIDHLRNKMYKLFLMDVDIHKRQQKINDLLNERIEYICGHSDMVTSTETEDFENEIHRS